MVLLALSPPQKVLPEVLLYLGCQREVLLDWLMTVVLISSTHEWYL